MNKIYLTLIVLLATMLSLISFAADIPRNILFWAIEGLGAMTLGFLLYFYRRVMRPIRVIGNGMELLNEQDFSSRLCRVGEPEADRIVEIFNKMMAELKEGRLRLQERNNLLDMLIEASPMGVIMLDFDGYISSMNTAARLMTGCTEDCIGRKIEDAGNELAKKIGTLNNGQAATFNMSDAHIYRCTHLNFIDRGFQHPFVTIERLTQEVMDAEREAYGKVIRMISHEVNNTTASINCIIETVNDELKSIYPETRDMQEALQACITRSGSMSAFITRFADVVKIPEPVVRNIPINSLITANIRFLESLCNINNVSLSTNLCDENISTDADEALMAQVLINIVKNSVESIKEKGAGTGIISITTSAFPAAITITDNGTGISPETEKKLFTPFFSTKPNGHGIGLLLIREILTRHKCHFSLKTGNDGMTIFRIEFYTLS